MAEFRSTVPATYSVEITPDDNNNLANPARCLYIETGGDIKVTTVNGSTDTIKVPSYFYLLLQVVKVFATGTTATGIHALR